MAWCSSRRYERWVESSAPPWLGSAASSVPTPVLPAGRWGRAAASLFSLFPGSCAVRASAICNALLAVPGEASRAPPRILRALKGTVAKF